MGTRISVTGEKLFCPSVVLPMTALRNALAVRVPGRETA